MHQSTGLLTTARHSQEIGAGCEGDEDSRTTTTTAKTNAKLATARKIDRTRRCVSLRELRGWAGEYGAGEGTVISMLAIADPLRDTEIDFAFGFFWANSISLSNISFFW